MLTPDNPLFTWKPIQAEAVSRLLDHASDRKPLLAVLNQMRSAGLVVISLEDKESTNEIVPLEDIDPFTFLSNFNRGLKTENRVALWKFLKEAWELKADIPRDFAGIPVVNNQKAWFFPYKHSRQESDIEILWEFAIKAYKGMDLVDDALFQKVLGIKQVALTKVTMGLFWIRPDRYIALDRKNIPKLQELGIGSDIKTWEGYLELVHQFKERTSSSISEFSHDAHLDATSYSISEAKLLELFERFKVHIPDFVDFEKPSEIFRQEETNYKHELLEEFNSEKALIDADLSSGSSISAINSLKKLIDKSKLVGWRAWDKMFGNPIRESESLELLRTISESCKNHYDGQTTLRPVFEVADKYKIKFDWTLLSVLLWLRNPEEYYPIKISVFRDVCMELGFRLKQSSPNPERFDEIMQFGYALYEALGPWNPKDWIDVQSFIWVVGGWDSEGDSETNTSSELEAPFDTCFHSLEEANILLDLSRSGFKGLGIDEHSMNDPRLAITLPKRISGRTGTLRVNFGNWPAFSIIKRNNGQRLFQFLCRQDLIPDTGLANDSLQPIKSSDVTEDMWICVPIETAKTPEFTNILYQSMEKFKERFTNWKGSPFRIHHIPELSELFFNEERRLELLNDGLASDTSEQDVDVSEPDLPSIETSNQVYEKADALAELFIDEYTYDRLELLLQRKKNIILQGAPGVGKSFIAQRLAYSIMGEKDKERVALIQFHQSYAYEDFIQGFRPREDGGFEKRDGVFYEFCKKAQADPTRSYYFVIDEINRGNLSRIFGELMLLIEEDKRGRDYELSLTYSPKQKFHVPSNVHLIGLMNTADRSLAMVDYALRRRFAFVTLNPEFQSPNFSKVLKEEGVSEKVIQKIRKKMAELNERIAIDTKDLGPGYRIGHSFFCPTGTIIDSEKWYVDVVETELRPLLEEYWCDQGQQKIKQEVDKLLDE